MPAPKRRTGLWVTLSVIVVLALVGGGALPAIRSTEAPTAEGAPTPAPTTPQERAEAEIETLVADYYTTTNAIYASTCKPITDIGQYTRGELREYRIQQHQSFRNSGQTITSGDGLMARDVEVANLDLAADPPTATINVCSGGSARGTDENGQPKSFNEDPKIVVYEAEYLSNQAAGAGVAGS